MKYKVLKECVIEHKYYEPGDVWIYRHFDDMDYNRKFVDRLTEHGFIEPIAEKPKTVWDLKKGDECSSIAFDVNIYNFVWKDYPPQKILRSNGNVFLTVEDAKRELARRKAKVILERDAKGFKPDWENDDEEKFYVFYHHIHNELLSSAEYSRHSEGIYFATEEDAEESIRKHEKEWKIYLGVEEEK